MTLKELSLTSGFQDTRTNNEDFAITPYIFGVYVNRPICSVIGIGICWGYYAIFIGITKNAPKNYPKFTILKKK